MSTAVEQSLQIVVQEPAATIAVAVLLGGGLVGMSIRNIVESVVVDEESGSDEGDGVATPSQSRTESDSEHSTASADAPAESDDAADPEELEHRLDELETEVGSLSSTVDTVRAENEQISNSVESVEQSTSRLVGLFKKAIGGGGAPTPDVDPEPASQAAEPEPDNEIQETEIIEPASADNEFTEKSNLSAEDKSDLLDDTGKNPGVREKHCVDSDEEIIDAPTQDAFQANAQDSTESAEPEPDTTEEVEEIGVGTFEGTRFESPETKSESFGIEETIETPAVASDGGTAVASGSGDLETDDGPGEPESPSIPDSTTDAAVESETDEPADDSETEDSDVAAEAAQLVAEADPAKSSAVESTVEPQSEADPAAETEPKTASTESPTAPSIEPETSEQETSEPETSQPEPEPATESDAAVATLDEITPSDGSSGSGKPYLETLPEGFGAELLTVEWLEYLVTEVGIKETSRALEYYKTIGWLTDEAATELDNYLDGLEAGDRGNLSVEHHLRTLEYVDELTMENAEEIK
jgi:flagellar protein FlaE